MLTTIEGYYEQGQIFLKEEAPVSEKTAVIITFLTENNRNVKQRKRIPGGLKGKLAIPDNFNQSLDDLKEYM